MIWLHVITAVATLALVLFVVVVFVSDRLDGFRPDRSDYAFLALAQLVGVGATLHLLLTLGGP